MYQECCDIFSLEKQEKIPGHIWANRSLFCMNSNMAWDLLQVTLEIFSVNSNSLNLQKATNSSSFYFYCTLLCACFSIPKRVTNFEVIFPANYRIKLGAIIKIPGILQRPGTKIIDPNFVTKWGTSFHHIPNLLQDQFFWLKFFLFFLKHNILMGTTLYYYVKGHQTLTNEPISQSILFF